MSDDHVKDQLCARIDGLEAEKMELSEQLDIAHREAAEARRQAEGEAEVCSSYRDERDALAEKARALIGEWRNGQFGDTAAQAESWRETAAQYARNEDFYRGIVRQIGELFGEEARTSDDGSVQDDVLALKVPELVEALAAHVERLTKAALDAIHHLPGGKIKAELRDAYDSAPATSLARLKAQWQAEALDEAAELADRVDGGPSQIGRELAAEAERLRRQAEGGV